MESYAYSYARKVDTTTNKVAYNIPEYFEIDAGTGELSANPTGRLPMKDLFDMYAGTDTGSIVSSALALQNDGLKTGTVAKWIDQSVTNPPPAPVYPKFWANDVVTTF